MFKIFGDDVIIHVYTRAQALEDGVLVDITETAKEAGFKYPTAVTTRVWEGVVMPENKNYEWRIWDICTSLHFAIDTSESNCSTILYPLMVPKGNNPFGKKIHLKAMISPGDDGSPVITIMFPDED